jgi:RimJ/RimL family protein N-acetyltransferase
MQNPFLIGEKVYLRPIEENDIDNYVSWLNDWDVRENLSMVLPFNKTRENEWIQGLYKDDKNIVLGIVLKGSDRLIGNIGLHGISMIHRHATLGIFIGDKTCWSKGFGTEAIKLVLKYGFEQLNLHRITLTVFDFNARARKAYEKAGFILEGTYREHLFRNGKYCDVYFMGILRSEWNKNSVSSENKGNK